MGTTARWRWLLATLLLTGGLAQPAQALQALTEQMPPYNYRLAGQPVSGFSVDLLHALLARSGLTLRGDIQLQPWARAYQNARYQAGSILFSVARTPEREQQFQWVGPVGPRTIRVWRLSSRTNIQPRSLQEAIHYRIAVVRNSASAQQLIRQGLAPVSVNSEEDKFRMLLRGRVDLVTALDLGAAFHMHQLGHGLEALTPLFVYDDGEQYYFALNLATEPAKVQALQRALDQMRQDGSLEALRRRWLNLHAVPPAPASGATPS
ncbi:substrate-binding periplasmic protein [Aeromonas hydrophila]